MPESSAGPGQGSEARRRSSLPCPVLPSVRSFARLGSRCPPEIGDISRSLPSHPEHPHSAPQKQLPIIKRGMPGVLSLAMHFDTSVTSTAIRYAKADTTPCIVLKWGSDGLAWKWFSQSMFLGGYRKVRAEIEGIPEDCPTRKALAGEAAPANGYFESGTTASAWFPFVRDQDQKNVIFIEQAMVLGRFGVLTILYPLAARL